jgi:hypothetical protein
VLRRTALIEEIQKDNGKKIYKYKEPSCEEKFAYLTNISDIFYDYLESLGFDKDKVSADYRLISEVFIRVDKRKDYFVIYHDETYINAVREAALLAYWILKFKPFMITSANESDYNVNINCGFAAYVIFCAVDECVRRRTQGKQSIELSEDYIEKFKYALKFWDIGKEAMMLIAETLCEHVMHTKGESAC